MTCLCCKVCLGCLLSVSAVAVQVEGVDELLIFISTSPRYKRWRLQFPSSCPSTGTCNRFVADGIESFLLLSVLCSLNSKADASPAKHFYSRPSSILPLARLTSINNTQLLAFITLIIWMVEKRRVEEKKNQSAKCWLRGLEGHSGAIFPHYDKWGVAVMQDRAHMATNCNLLHCNCSKRHVANSISHLHSSAMPCSNGSVYCPLVFSV